MKRNYIHSDRMVIDVDEIAMAMIQEDGTLTVCLKGSSSVQRFPNDESSAVFFANIRSVFEQMEKEPVWRGAKGTQEEYEKLTAHLR